MALPSRVVTDPDEMFRHLASAERAAGAVRKSGDGIIVTKYSAAISAPPKRTEKTTGDTVVNGVPDLAEVRRLATSRGIDFEDEDLGRVLPWWASDERVDSQGDIIRQAGWEFDLIEKNGPLLFGHRAWEPPIGRIMGWSVRQRGEKDYAGPGLWLLNYFAKGDPIADRIHRFVKGGILTSGSVGFRPIEILLVQDEEERKALGLGRYGVVVQKQKLTEFSVVSMPANDGATVIRALELAKDSGSLVDAEDVQLLRELAREECSMKSPDAWREVDDFYRGAGQFLFPGNSWRSHRDVQEPIVKRSSGPERVSETNTDLAKMQNQISTVAHMMGLLLSDVREVKDLLAGDGCDKNSGKGTGGPGSESGSDGWDPFE